jgi:hypothetical protein
MAHALSVSVLDFIHQCIPTPQAAEVLLIFVGHPDRSFKPEDVVGALRPSTVTVPAVKEYMARFLESGLIAARPDGYVYAPASPAIEHAARELGHAYDKRPVTLIAAIHRIADNKIQIE